MAARRSPAKKASVTRTSRGISYRAFVRLALKLPGVEESTSYGTPSLKVKGKMLTRIWDDAWRRSAPPRLVAARTAAAE